jgi:choline dehydrogenase-like flavoprotein
MRTDRLVIADARALAPDSALRCDVCVVGGGAAGLTTALECSAAGLDVVVLEAGGRRRDRLVDGTAIGETGPNAVGGDRHPPLEAMRQKQLGGTTSWGGRCAPLDPIDFEPLDGVRADAWPIRLADLAPYYARAHEWLQLGYFEYSASRALKGSDTFLLGDTTSSVIEDRKLYRYSPPTNFAKAYGREIAGRRLLRVFCHANVLRLELDDTGSCVSRAIVASVPGRRLTVDAEVFVLAAGGLETTRLLLESGRAAERSIGTGFDWVGRCYATHLDGIVGDFHFRNPAPRAAHAYERSRDGVYCRRIVSISEVRQRLGSLGNLAGVFYMPDPNDPSHGDGLLSMYALAKAAASGRHSQGSVLRRHAGNVVRNPRQLSRFGTEWSRRRWFSRRKIPSFLHQSRSGAYRMLFSAEQASSGGNTLVLADDVDTFGVPRLRVRWRVTQEDYARIARSLTLIAIAFEETGAGFAQCPRTADELAAALGGGFVAGTHTMGTTRMSATPASGVVDPDGRVHGVPNLYIASSSTFPTGGFAPPTLTIVALAVLVADRVRREIPLRGSPAVQREYRSCADLPADTGK